VDRLTIEIPRLDSDASGVRLSALVRLGAERFELWFAGPAPAIGVPSVDAMVVALVPLAMHLGVPLASEAPVSGRLLSNLVLAQSILAKWYPALKRVRIEAQVSQEPVQRAAGTAVFFSGGVDSLYTTYQHLDDIDTLILVHGFDVALDNVPLRKTVSRRMHEAASALGKPLVEVATNSRVLSDRYVSWPDHQFGAALASVGHALGGRIGRAYIASSESYAHLDPCGSHPLLDPLWSTERVEFVHDGAEASRNEKVAYLKTRPGSLRHLRVCWENPGSSFNCGRCEKCIRTMINLQTAGALQEAPVFDAALDTARVAAMKIPMDLVLFHVEENLRVLRNGSGDPRLIEALETSIGRYRSERALKELMSLRGRERTAVAVKVLEKTFSQYVRARTLR
jgi:hypothetical protein